MSPIAVSKTIKLFIGGKFPRTESGRSFALPIHGTAKSYAQVCQGSRKDIRGAVEVAKKAQQGWSQKTAFLRGQILYRMAEMLQGKHGEFVEILKSTRGLTQKDAVAEVDQSIADFVFYAGFADKFAQVMSSLNPVSGPFHNFTAPESMGVVGWVHNGASLSSLIRGVSGILCSGNSVVAILNPEVSGVLGALGEVFATSDLPPGVVNLISGYPDELCSHLAAHMEVQGMSTFGCSAEENKGMQISCVDNMKRFVVADDLTPLERITRYTELKTVWHTIGV